MQIVQHSTGEETFQLMLKEFESIKAPTVVERCNTRTDKLLSGFMFRLDAGPDNQGTMKRVARQCMSCAWVFFAVVWCTFPQAHLIAKCQLEYISDCEFAGHEMKVSYFSAVSSVVNVWRSTGLIGKMRSTAVKLFGFDHMVRKMPGRCLRGRWGSIQDAEKAINTAKDELPAIFLEQ